MAYRKIKKDGTKAKPTKANKIPFDEFAVKANDYLSYCEKNKLTPLLQELAITLGIDEETLWKYRQKPKYGNVIKRVDKIAEIAWIRHATATNKPIFPIFMLKAKYNYVEQQYQKVDLTIKGLGNVVMPSKKPRISS